MGRQPGAVLEPVDLQGRITPTDATHHARAGPLGESIPGERKGFDNGRNWKNVKRLKIAKELKGGYLGRVTVYYQPLGLKDTSSRIPRLAAVVAVVFRRQALDQQNTIELVHLVDGEPVLGVDRLAVLEPGDGEGQVALDDGAGQGGTLAQVEGSVRDKGP